DDALLLARDPRGGRRDARAARRAGGGGARGNVRRLVLLSLAAAVVAGCGSQPKHVTMSTAAAPPPKPKPKSKPRRLWQGRNAVQVTVVDGDTNRRVAGARVQIGHHAARSNLHGVALLRLAHRSALVAVASKPGYGERAVRFPFRRQPK